NYTKEETFVCMLELCEEACRRGRTDRMVGKTVQLSIGYDKTTDGGFHRSKSLILPTNSTMEMYHICVQLFEQFYNGTSYIRKVSVTLTNLCRDDETQLHLFYERPKQKDIGYVMDEIRSRYGSTA